MGMPNGTSLCTEASWARPPLSYALDALAAPIIETVVTTINPDRSVNCGVMGVEWGEQRIVIKPFRGTRTLRNLRATGAAVVNLTDDILLFSQAALGDPHPPTRPASGVA